MLNFSNDQSNIEMPTGLRIMLLAFQEWKARFRPDNKVRTAREYVDLGITLPLIAPFHL